MRAGLYRPVHVKSLRSQKLRMLLTHRKLLQSKAIAIDNDLRGTLRNFGLKVGMVGTVKFEARIKELVENLSECSHLEQERTYRYRACRLIATFEFFLEIKIHSSASALRHHKFYNPTRFIRFSGAVLRRLCKTKHRDFMGLAWVRLMGCQPVNLSNPILLTDGTVIAHNGTCFPAPSRNWYKLTPDNTGLFSNSYINGTWSAIAQLPVGYAPRFFGSGVLPDGRVIIEGGEYNVACGAGNSTTKGAIYDPVADTWTAVNPPSGWTTIGDGGGIVLPNGTYMQTAAEDSTPRAALLDPTTLTWTATGTGKFDAYEEESMALMQDDTVLTVDSYCSK